MTQVRQGRAEPWVGSPIKSVELVDAVLMTFDEVRAVAPDIPFSVTDRRKKTGGSISEHPMGVFLGHHPIHPVNLQLRKPDGSLPVSGEPLP